MDKKYVILIGSFIGVLLLIFGSTCLPSVQEKYPPNYYYYCYGGMIRFNSGSELPTILSIVFGVMIIILSLWHGRDLLSKKGAKKK